ncbi:crystallin J1A-like [Mytilus trossulus]|uniref:crystallin J1A-like n=1 Tax=Mytilus trossulus TaxID=6551 RepID=UPI003006EC4B
MTCEERRIAAVVGALIADAAAQPLHWNYNIDKLNTIIGDEKEIAFWEPSANPFYCRPRGSHSCYGDQSYVILKSLVTNNGLDVPSLQKSTYEFFGPNTDYDDKDNKEYETKSDVSKKVYPIKAGWRHGSVKAFLKKFEQGLEDTGCDKDEQMDCVLRIVPVVALYAGRPDMLEKAESVIRVTQNSDTSVAVGLAAARILEQYILYGEKEDVVECVIEELNNPNRTNPQDLDKALAGQLREVLQCKDIDHRTAAKKFRID